MTQEYKDIKGYEGLYQVSNLGEVKSLRRLVNRGGNSFIIQDRVLKKNICTSGYLGVNLSKNGVVVSRRVHQLVAESFLNHTPCGYKMVVNHIDLNKLNNSIDNLEVISNRDNSNKKHIKSSSKYTGVHANNNGRGKKWKASININNKSKHLGYFDNEYEAHLEYIKALSSLRKKPLAME